MPLVAVSWEVGLGIGIAATLAVVVIAELASGGTLRIFGPVLYYEMVRAGRRGRIFLLRSAYALFIFLLLFWIWTSWGRAPTSRTAQIDELARLAEYFFVTFAIIQFGFVLLLTPGYVAGCIADDKERRTLEFLLATDLANREVIFGKLAARIGNLLLFLLTGLPVLSLIQFFGGIDPTLLLLTFAGTGLTMLGLVGISIVQSVQRRKVRDAIILSFIVAISYEAICLFLWLGTVFATAPGSRNTAFGQVIVLCQPYFEVFQWGEPIRAIGEVFTALSLPLAGPALLTILMHYAAFHLSIFALGVVYAVWRLRKIALRQAGGSDAKKQRVAKRRRSRRPPVSSRRPMTWKEIWIEGRLRLGALAQVGLYLLVAMAFTPLGIAAYMHWFDPTAHMSWHDFQNFINIWVRVLNVALSCLILLGIAVRAAGSVGGERDRDTLVSLLTTTLTAGEMLAGKFWGALASVRGLALWLGAVWTVGLLSTSVSMLAMPMELFFLITPSIAAATIGLFFSVACPTSLRALMFTLGAMVFVLGGHWLATGMCCYAPAGLTGFHMGVEYEVAFQTGMTPPAMFAMAPIASDDIWYTNQDNPTYVAVAFVGNACWLLVAGAAWMATYDRFARLTNRVVVPPSVQPPDFEKTSA
jgi:ABC-type transport system involved in multi-copper enzyme maturation permease subunit